MALVGVIKSGTVSSICRSISQAKGDVLLLLERDQQVGHLVFEKGELVKATLGALSGSDAMHTVERWSTGMYSLIKREPDEPTQARTQVLVIGIDLETRKRYEGWLKEHGFSTNVVTHHKQAFQVAGFLNPSVVIMGCPKLGQKMTCEEFREQMAAIMGAPPLVVTIADLELQCEDPNILCQVKPLALEQLDRLLSKRWPNTLYGQHRDQERHLTRRISSEYPMLVPPTSDDSVSLESEKDDDLDGDDEEDTNPQAFPPEISDEFDITNEVVKPTPVAPPAAVTGSALDTLVTLPSARDDEADEVYGTDESTEETTNVVVRRVKPMMILIAVAVLALASGLFLLLYFLK
jgi:hypothetical protein